MRCSGLFLGCRSGRLARSALAIFSSVLTLLSCERIGHSHASDTQATPQQEIASGAGYVGSKLCGECHRAIYNSFSQTDMGRSISVVSPQFLERIPNSEHVYDAKLNRNFEVSVRGGNLYQDDYETGSDG